MQTLPRIVIISNAHKANDVRLYHKIGKSLCKIAAVHVIGARGIGSLVDDQNNEQNLSDPDDFSKPIRMIASGTSPILRLISLYHQTKRIKPDVVICIEPLTMLVGLLLRKNTGCKLVYDAHEFYAAAHGEKYSSPLNTIVSLLYFVVEKALQSRMDLTLAVNDDIYKMFHLKAFEAPNGGKQQSQTSVSNANIGIVLPNYPTKEIWKDNLYDCGLSSQFPDTQFDTIYLGGLSETRGIMKLLQVVSLLHIQNPQFKALFVGKFITEEFKTKFFDYVMDNNLNPHVFWHDAVPPDKVCAIMSQVKIGLSVMHPRYKKYRKTLNLKVLEYLAAGVPVIANDFPQFQAIIGDYKLGYCVPFHTKDIADAVIKLLNINDDKRKALSDNCRRIVKEKYMWDAVEPRLLEAIQALL